MPFKRKEYIVQYFALWVQWAVLVLPLIVLHKKSNSIILDIVLYKCMGSDNMISDSNWQYDTLTSAPMTLDLATNLALSKLHI